MKFRSFNFNLFVFIFALFFGLAWVAVFNVFLGSGSVCKPFQKQEIAAFDIKDANSVLPLDFEEDKLSSPKADESNPAYFDPEGYYYFIDEPSKEFADFKQFNISNKNFDVDPKDRRYGELVEPTGALILIDEKKGTYIRFKHLEVTSDGVHFTAESKNGLSYEFQGNFLVKGNFYTLEENAKVLEGVLTKIENGKTVAESSVSFGWGIDF